MSHSDGSHVACNEIVRSDSPALAHRGRRRSSPVGYIHAVGDKGELLLRDSSPCEVTGEGPCHADYPACTSIELKLDLLEQSECEVSAHGPHRSDRIGPEISQLEYPWDSLQSGRKTTGDRAEELRRGGDDHVELSEPKTPKDGRRHERGVIHETPERTLICCQVRPDPMYVDPVDDFPRIPDSTVPGIGPAGRVTRHASDHVNFVARLDPFPAVLQGPAGRSIYFRGEVVRQEQDPHARSHWTKKPVEHSSTNGICASRQVRSISMPNSGW